MPGLIRHTFYKKIIYLLFISIFIFSSCVSVSPVSSEENKFSNFFSIDNIEIDNVNSMWRNYAAGIDYFHGKIESPRMEFWALRIDLDSPNIKIFCGGGGLSRNVSSFVRENNLIAGINAVPFDFISSREGQPIKNIGMLISDGKILSAAHPFYDAIIFYNTSGTALTRSGVRAAIVKQNSVKPSDNILNAAGGFFQILKDGKASPRTMKNSAHDVTASNDASSANAASASNTALAAPAVLAARHPRSAAGVSKDGRFLYLLAVDGRRSGSAGSTEKETAQILFLLGAWDGLNLDGGGSTALVMRNKNGVIRPLNTPIHNGFPGMERAVAGCIGIKTDF